MPAADTNIEDFRGCTPQHFTHYSNSLARGAMGPSVMTSPGHRSTSVGGGPIMTETGNLRDRSKLLQLAERTSTKKMSPATGTPQHLLSFRTPSKKTNVIGSGEINNSFLRRNNSTAIISSESPVKPNRNNPKLYTSFSSKSASKFTRAFIKSDPAKTNIEHLVSPVHKKASSSPNSAESNKSTKSDHCESGRGLSNFITPLKALHASFHDRTKLVNAFSPRSRLSSQREKSASNARLISSPISSRTTVDVSHPYSNGFSSRSVLPLPSPSSSSDVSSDTPEDTEHFPNQGNQQLLQDFGNNMRNDEINGSNHHHQKTRQTPDILENCMELNQDCVFQERVRGYKSMSNDHESGCDNFGLDNGNGSKSSTHQDQIKSITSVSDKKKQLTSNTIDTEELFNESNSHCHPRSKMMSTATPMKLSSSSANRAQIITLMTRGTGGSGVGSNNASENNHSGGFVVDDNKGANETTVVKNSHDSGRVSAGADLKEGLTLQLPEELQSHLLRKKSHHQSSRRNNQPQKEDHSPSSNFTGSSFGVDSKSGDKSETDLLLRKQRTSTSSSSAAAINMGMISSNVLHERRSSKDFDHASDYKTDDEQKRQYFTNEFTRGGVGGGGTGLDAKKSAHLHLNNDADAFLGKKIVSKATRSSVYQINNAIGIVCDGAEIAEGRSVIEHNDFSISSSSQRKVINNGSGAGNNIGKPSARRLSSRSARLKSKCRPLMHSLSFRSETKKASNEDAGSSSNVSSEYSRNRSRSLPKSFMSVSKYGLRSVLPSLWTRDELLFHRLEERKHSSPDTSPLCSPFIVESELPDKMRWQKSATSTSNSGADGRPKSCDYAQRKAWMKYYRDMEVSSATNSSKGTKGLSKGSISHLHLVASQEDILGLGHEDGQHPIQGHPNPSEMVAIRTPDPLGLPSSLFQRFSKTFSLRFGSNSNVSKTSSRKGKGPLGSSPDLLGKLESQGGDKMRKGKSKSIRGEKCQSGDSGIGIDDPPITNRLRRIRSEVLETGLSSSSSNKMSLVEIPNHVWDESSQNRNSSVESSNLTSAHTASYEDILDAKLDRRVDDGFSSGDEDSNNVISGPNDSGRLENPAYYHSLPSKNSRKKKQIELANQLANSSGRTKSLEDSQQQLNTPEEDNSIRGKVIKEIVLTEQNYVKTLNDIVQGFLVPCRARRDLFSSETVRNIFSNIEDILRLHAKFLEAIKQQLNPHCISASNVGQIFTEWADHFELYSEYCCNNPISMATVRSLIQVHEYAEFFEACRRLQLMDKLPLHGFLLRPIQRICQYHLQLNELLKQTEATHDDYPAVVEAVETMKSVAMKVNDTQRQFDSLQEIIRAQNSVDNWEGSDLLSRNSVILSRGELLKANVNKRHKETYVFLLNKDLVYCKKDFIRKGGYVFDGRIDLEVGVWLNIDSNYEDEFFGMVHNSWRVYNPDLKNWILFTAPSPVEKRKWITALERTSEVFPIDRKMCEMAKLITVLSQENTPSGHNYSASCNTLPKSSKKSKKNSSNTMVAKVDADAMLIEVSKLKRSAYTNQQQPSQKERTSKFYV